MEIRLASLITGAREAQGTVVILDVYRAFTTAAIAFSRGAESIALVAEVKEALSLRERGLGDVCMGEVDGVRPDGFDFGNSPFEVSTADLAGKRVIQSTRAGTVGVAGASKAEHIYVASLVVAQATAMALLRSAPELVTIVAMGAEGVVRTDEDEQCALYLRNLLLGRRPDPGAVRSLVMEGAESLKYGDPDRPHFHPMDREMALRIDSAPIAMRVSWEQGLPIARAESF